ncbi:TetR family transcriptional regulator [Bailinhaonella thermotolerans]|uniref:TetR family transcriptional regulator n=1 Tax=Bailinhaonella thermotolerans TaxID=1070861 RepID=A0A3A4BM66_9ACTN|nr:TetR family transcriptional regulator [Bailinhaonella thermotolerans]RJL32122.1 TetR family transcriptional regulator [Bailinhaonella thermotolerans]
MEERSQGEPSTAERILDTARALFASRGYGATSMREIAGRVGITKPALYYHFDSKEEILRRLTLPLLDELEAALAEAAGQGDPETVRWRAIEGYVDVHLRHRETLIMLVKDMSLLAQAPVAERFRAAIRWANDLVLGPGGGLAERVRAAQAVAGLGDAVVAFPDVPADRLRPLILDGARVLLNGGGRGEPGPGPVGSRPRGRRGGRPSALTGEQARQARTLYAEGRDVQEIAAGFGVSRATVYRVLRTRF